MKRIHKITIYSLCLLAFATSSAFAQTKSTTVTPKIFPEVSFQNSKITESQELRGEDILWKREVYRMVDLNEGMNGTLYFPVEPTPGQMNLFCTIFSLLADGKLNAFEYLDGREVFNDDNTLKFKDMLKRFDILFREKPDPKKANSSIFEIDDMDLLSNEVTLFYVKEAYYIEQRNSTVGRKTLAICPVLIRTDEVGETRKYPMFWIPFSSLKNNLSQIPIWADTINSVNRMNAYDFFNMHLYKGDIYKVSNLKNQSLWDYCTTPDEIVSEQLRLEKELSNIANALDEPSQREFLEIQARLDAEKKEAEKAAKKKK